MTANGFPNADSTFGLTIQAEGVIGVTYTVSSEGEEDMLLSGGVFSGNPAPFTESGTPAAAAFAALISSLTSNEAVTDVVATTYGAATQTQIYP